MDFENKSKQWYLSGGFDVYLIQCLSIYFNFTYQIINCNNEWGDRLTNNTWTGIIGKIVNKVS